MTGTDAATVSGDNTFYNLSCQVPGKTVSFEAGKTQTVLAFGTLTLEGASGNDLVLQSTAASDWFLTLEPNGMQSVANVAVSDSNASGGETIVAPTGTDNGNNTNWNFSSGATITWTGATNTLSRR